LVPVVRAKWTVQLSEKLLGLALGRGADYADLFFEYRAAAASFTTRAS